MTHVAQVFAQRYPRYLLRVVNRHEEFYALLMFFVERHYLRKHGSFYVSMRVDATQYALCRCLLFRELLWAQKAAEAADRDGPGQSSGAGCTARRTIAG